MLGRIIAFRLPPGMSATRRVQFNHRLWGRRTSSAGGRYQHARAGVMDEIPHRRLVRGVVLIQEEDLEKVRAFMEQWDVETHVRRVELEPTDEAAFQAQP